MFIDFFRLKNVLSKYHTVQDEQWKGVALFLFDHDFVYLIKRSEAMPSHGGQIGFIGGYKKIEENFPFEVAKREFTEETGLNECVLDFIGYMPLVYTARNVGVIPVLCRLKISCEDFFLSAKTNGEWDFLIAYPLVKLTGKNSWEFGWRYGMKKSPILFHSIKAESYFSNQTTTKTHILWGATAQMIWSFLSISKKE